MSRSKKPIQPAAAQMCRGKRCYLSLHQAEIVLEQQELMHRDLHLAIYKCTDCQKWHLTRDTRKTF